MEVKNEGVLEGLRANNASRGRKKGDEQRVLGEEATDAKGITEGGNQALPLRVSAPGGDGDTRALPNGKHRKAGGQKNPRG